MRRGGGGGSLGNGIDRLGRHESTRSPPTHRGRTTESDRLGQDHDHQPSLVASQHSQSQNSPFFVTTTSDGKTTFSFGDAAAAAAAARQDQPAMETNDGFVEPVSASWNRKRPASKSWERKPTSAEPMDVDTFAPSGASTASTAMSTAASSVKFQGATQPPSAVATTPQTTQPQPKQGDGATVVTQNSQGSSNISSLGSGSAMSASNASSGKSPPSIDKSKVSNKETAATPASPSSSEKIPTPLNQGGHPKAAFYTWCNRNLRLAPNETNYFVWSNGAKPHETVYTAAFVDPRTGEVFLSGRYGDAQFRSVHEQEGTVWYTNKKFAKHGAASRAYDCFTYRVRHSAGKLYEQIGLEVPYDEKDAPPFVPPPSVPPDTLQQIQEAIAAAKGAAAPQPPPQQPKPTSNIHVVNRTPIPPPPPPRKSPQPSQQRNHPQFRDNPPRERRPPTHTLRSPFVSNNPSWEPRYNEMNQFQARGAHNAAWGERGGYNPSGQPRGDNWNEPQRRRDWHGPPPPPPTRETPRSDRQGYHGPPPPSSSSLGRSFSQRGGGGRW